MELRNGETGQVWDKVDFFRLSLHVPWNGGFAQVRNSDVTGDAKVLSVHKANILSDETVLGVRLFSLCVCVCVCVCVWT